MFYNTDICKKAGLLDPDGNLKTIDDPAALTDALDGRQEGDRSYGGVVSINSDHGHPLADLLRRCTTSSAAACSPTTGTRSCSTTARRKGADASAGPHRQAGASCPRAWTTPARSTAFATGKAGFYFQGDWEITTFQTAKTPFSMTRSRTSSAGSTRSRRTRTASCCRRTRARTDAMRPARSSLHPLDARPEQHVGAGRPHPGLAAVPEERGLRAS